MKKNTKKIFMAILAVVAVASLTIAGTMALLQSSDTKTNTLTIGKVQVNIDEPGWTNPNCPQTPGNPVTKDPRVTNNGTVNAFVRAKITWPKDLNGQNLFVIATGNAITTDINQWGSTSSGKFPWYQSSDGWLYYYDIVPVSQQTTPLFTSVELDPALTSINLGSITTADIKIDAQGIQTMLNNVEFTNAVDAFTHWS